LDQPEQDALFYIEGSDEDVCVWVSSTDAPGGHHYLGATHKVAEVLSQRPASIGDGEGETAPGKGAVAPS
jgi:hypothetical protein